MKTAAEEILKKKVDELSQHSHYQPYKYWDSTINAAIIEAMEEYAVEYAKSLKEDKSIISARQKESEVKSFMIPFEPLETNENGEIKCGDCNKFYRCVNCDEPCGSEGHWLTLARIGEISKITESFLKRRKSQKCSSCEIDEVITDGYCNCCGAKQLSYSPPKTDK